MNVKTKIWSVVISGVAIVGTFAALRTATIVTGEKKALADDDALLNLQGCITSLLFNEGSSGPSEPPSPTPRPQRPSSGPGEPASPQVCEPREVYQPFYDACLASLGAGSPAAALIACTAQAYYDAQPEMGGGTPPTEGSALP